MTNVTVLIDTIDKVKSFVQAVADFNGELDLSTGRYTIDAKSIMGIFSLDISKPMTLTIYNTADAPILLDRIRDYII